MVCDNAMNSKENDASRTIHDERIGHFNERLLCVINEESLRSFAQRANVSEGSLRNLIKGGYPRLDSLVDIAIAGNVNIEWLATGKGPMRPGEQPSASADASELVREFALIPGYNIQVSAGSGALPTDETPTRKLAFRHKWLKYKGLKEKDLVLVFADGDSMEPTISDNNTLMIDTSQRELKDGHIYVIRTNSHLIVKRVQTLWNKGILLLSDNKEYKEQQVEPNEADDLEVIGRVVWIGKDV